MSEVSSFGLNYKPWVAGGLLSGLMYLVYEWYQGRKLLPESMHEEALVDAIIDPDDITDSFDSVGGLKKIKQTVLESVVWPFNHRELFQADCPLGILLHGPPGTGKTLLARCIAKEVHATFLEVRVESIVNKWLGESQKLAAALFSLAKRKQPTIIFIDELDALLSNNSVSTSDIYQQIRAIFLRHWDGIQGNTTDSRVLVIGATNKPADIDDAVLRRFTVKIEVPPPTTEDRKEILRIMLKDQYSQVNSDDIDWIATHTQGYTGADLKNLCREAKMGPIRDAMAHHAKTPTKILPPAKIIPRDINKTDFEKALGVVQPNSQFISSMQQPTTPQEQFLHRLLTSVQ